MDALAKKDDTYLDSLRSSLHEIFAHDERVLLLGEDVLDPYGGAFKVTKGLSEKFPGRVVPSPICEASLVGLGVGLSLRGMRPIIEIMFGDFITLAADQLINHAAKFSGMYAGQVEVPLVVRTPMGAGRGYGPTHSQSLEKMFFGIPNLKVVAPSLWHSPGELLKQAVRDNGPVLFVEHKMLYPLVLGCGRGIIHVESDSDETYPVSYVRNYDESDQADVVVITYGGISRFIEALLIRLFDEEIRCLFILPSHINNRNLPIEALQKVHGAGRVVVVEEGTSGFGWCAEIAKQIYELYFDKLLMPIVTVAAKDCVIPSNLSMEKDVIVTEDNISDAIYKVLGI